MAPASKKRKLPVGAVSTSKRSKLSTKPNTENSTKRRNNGNKRTAVDASSLQWQMVGEEFGGLEVIEGVDVVKEGNTVQFLVSDNAKANKNGAGSIPDTEEYDDDESFEGFGDDPSETSQNDEATLTTTGGKKKKKTSKQDELKQKRAEDNDTKQNQKNKKKKNKEKGDQNGKLTDSTNNAFDALADMEGPGDEDTDMGPWAVLDLSPRILSAIAKLGFSKPTRIQQKSIPKIVAGEDVIGKAQTGSGKTLAFGIPIVEKWLDMFEGEDALEKEDETDKTDEEEEEDAATQGKSPMALILSPTRELAKQLGDHLKALCDALPTAPYVCVVTGGLSIYKQQRQLAMADIVIGTPGRLWEVLDGDMALQTSFTKIKFLVVDEADRLFKAGQFKEAEQIIGALDRRDPESMGNDSGDEDDLPPRQTLVFSATFDKDLQTKLAGKARAHLSAANREDQMAYLMKSLQFRQEPKFIDANPVARMAEGLKEGLIECGAMEKDLYLYTVLLLNPGRRTLVFTNSISAVRRLTPLLQNLGLTVQPLHSQMAQKARLRSLERFTAANNAILVATDVAARGLDIKNVSQVLHYHVPRAADTYIHRSGRTARGEGGSGVSVILCSPDEVLPTRRLTGRVHAERASGRRDHVIQTLTPDRKIATRLKPRVDLAKRLADAVLAKEKGHSDDTWLKNAADELGVDFDVDDFEDSTPNGWGGRGGGRKRKEKEARMMSKAEMGSLRAQLREELSRRVNLGVSERYISGGRVDMAALLREREKQGSSGIFLGGDGLGLGI